MNLHGNGLQKKYENEDFIRSYILILIPPRYIYNYYYGENKIEMETDSESEKIEFVKEYKDLKYFVERNYLYVYMEI